MGSQSRRKDHHRHRRRRERRKKEPKKLVLLKRIIINDDQKKNAKRDTKEDYERTLDRLAQLEAAATLIQRNARQRLPKMAEAAEASKRRRLVNFANDDDSLWDIDEVESRDAASDMGDQVTVTEKEEEEESKWFALIFLSVGALIVMGYTFFSWCFRGACLRGVEQGMQDDPNMVEPTEFTETTATQANPGTAQIQAATTPAASGGGGGGGGPSGSGIESAAANSAVGSVASGVTTGIAAGAVAAGTAGVMGGTMAQSAAATATTVTTKVVAAVAVTAAVYSTVQAVTPDVVALPASKCGIENPEIRSGDFTLSFEGLARGVTDRETTLLEGLVVNAYNNLTFGHDYNPITQTYNCVDEYLREMKESKLMDQVFTKPSSSRGNLTTSLLEIDLEATILCQDCPATLPIFGKEENAGPNQAPSIERYLRRMSTVEETFDISFIEVFLRSIIESLFELMNEGELPLNLAPSKIYFRGLSNGRGNETDGNQTSLEAGEDDAVEVNIPVGIYDDKINGAIIPVFPTASTNQNNGVNFHEGDFNMSLTGVRLSRPFTAEESVLLENLFVEAYNEVTGGGENGSSLSESLREMARSSLIGQTLITGEDGQPTLQLSFRGFVTCEGCPSDQSLFGDVDGDGLDLEMIQRVLQRIIVDVVDAIEDEELPAEFLPNELSVEDEATNSDLVNVPIFTNVGDDGTIEVDMPVVGLAPVQFQDEFFISFRGFDRMFNEEETQIVQALLLDAYNRHALGNDNGDGDISTPESYNRRMLNAVLSEQDFTEGDTDTGLLSTLDMTLDVSVLCDDCPPDQPVFGVERDGVDGGLLDWTFIEAVMINVIGSLMQNIENDVLPDSFVPDEISTHTDETQDFFVSIPIESYFDPETGTYVVEFQPTVVELPSNAPSLSSSTSTMPTSTPTVEPSAQGTSMGPSLAPSVTAVTDESETPSTIMPSSVSGSTIPSPVPSASPSQGAVSETSAKPSSMPSARPSARPSTVFSGQPTPLPSLRPSKPPSIAPSVAPSSSPSRSPTSGPSSGPTNAPVVGPTTSSPTPVPTSGPTSGPTSAPVVGPTLSPTPGQTSEPTSGPTSVPVVGPTLAPTSGPTSGPTTAPVVTPTLSPTSGPTSVPTRNPTKSPTSTPTLDPTSAPTSQPTSQPVGASSRYWVTCGTYLSDGSNCLGITPQFVDMSATTIGASIPIAVRCCADSRVNSNWMIASNSLWATDGDPNTNCPWAYTPNSCNTAVSYADAQRKCENTHRGRLCTRAELEAGCATQTGCSFDSSPVWSSTPE